MVFDIYTLVESIWVILPAYVANGLVSLVRFFTKKPHPIDFGKTWKGKPVFGKNKTWEGLMFGCLIGMLIGWIEMLSFPFLPFHISPVPLKIIPMSALLGFLLGFGAMAGDTVESFLKRRLNIKPGKPLPVLDQLDFLIGAVIFSSLVMSWEWEWIVLLIILTPVFHFVANITGYLLKIKKYPW